MQIVNHQQTWKGFFAYLEGFEAIDEYTTVEFTMEVTFNGNSFTGTATDTESENVFKEPALVKGFIEDDKISFVKNYPCYYYKDENGKIALDESLSHPNIEYLGFYDESEKKFLGTWEMIVDEEKISEDQYLEEVISGDFEIQRIK